MQKSVFFLEKIEKFLLILGLFLVPLFFFPWLLSPFGPAKLAVLGIFMGLVLIVCSLKTILKGSLTFFSNNFDLPVILLALAYLVSALIRTPNKMEAFFIPGTASLFIVSAILFFLIKPFSSEKKGIVSALTLSGVLVSIVSLLATAGVLSRIPQLPTFVKDPLFTTLGGKVPEIIFLGLILPLGLALVFSEKEAVKKAFWAVSSAVVALALAISVYKVLPGKPAHSILPDLPVSWFIAVDTLKVSPIFGIGAGNYLSAFNRFRPISYNSIPTWSLRFTTAENYALTLVTETGFLGLAALILLFLKAVKTTKSKIPFINAEPLSLDTGILISLALAIIFLFTLPLEICELLILITLLSLASKPKEISFQVPVLATQEKSFVTKLPVIFVTVPVILGVLAVGFYGSRAYAAELTYKKSLEAVAKNDGQTAYDLMIKTINLNPLVDRYHNSYAQFNLVLAGSVAQKKDLTDEERNTITQLIQQAIREGKAVVSLNPERAGNWEALAGIYQAIMPFAQGADNFTIQTYNQAVALDPLDPNLRISLGGVLYALGRFDESIDALKLAVLAKPDLANAHYNLSAAYREKGDIEKAISEMNTVLSLVEADSADYKLAKSELDDLEKKRPVKETGGTSNLTPPQPAEKPVIEPPLELPQEATPPASP